MLFWHYLLDACDHAGIWKPNKVFFEKTVGVKVDLKLTLRALNAEKPRITVLSNGRWFLANFIPFQYGRSLNLRNRLHSSVFKLLQENSVDMTSIRPQVEVMYDLKDGVKDKDKDKDNNNLLVRRESERRFEKPTEDDVSEYALRQNWKIDSKRFFDFYESKGWMVGKNKMKDWRAAVRNWIRNSREREFDGFTKEQKFNLKQIGAIDESGNVKKGAVDISGFISQDRI